MRKRKWKKSIALLLTVVMTLTTGVTSQANETAEATEITEGEINYSDGNRYEGSVSNGKREGNGTIYYKSGTWIRGVWHDDVQQGPGEIHYTDGKIFTGFWVDGEITGSGLCVYADGSSSRYTYRDGKANGLSVKIDKDGKISAAIYENHKKAETKLVTWTNDDGTVYYAEKKSDVTDEGSGIAISEDSVYIGEFKNGELNGIGTIYFGCDYFAAGYFEDGIPSGILTGYILEDGELQSYMKGVIDKNEENLTGICYSSDGTRMVGTFDDEGFDRIFVKIKKDGTIEIFRNDGNEETNITSQLWKDSSGNSHIGTKKNGGIDGYGLRIYKNGTIYIGNFSEGQTNGMGLCYFPESDVFTYGENKGVSNGNAVYSWPSGTYYVGEFQDGKKNGNGTVYYMDGGKMEGVWKDDSFYSGNVISIQDDGSVSVKIYKDGKVAK